MNHAYADFINAFTYFQDLFIKIRLRNSSDFVNNFEITDDRQNPLALHK